MLKWLITVILFGYLFLLIWRGIKHFFFTSQNFGNKENSKRKKTSNVNYDNVIDADYEIIEDNSKEKKKTNA